ncbi:MAG TPA: ribonuclease H-like domain-containing protein [Nitrospiria bacterium]|jgi:DEAD/DEAH box helicase domain-containing protein
MPGVSKNIVFFDLETQKSADEVGGWENKHLMRVSIGVTYSTRIGDFQVFEEDDVQELIEVLKEADLVIGYNIVGFDYPVLTGYSDFDFSKLSTFDILANIKQRLGFRLKLENVAQATLNAGKMADGLAALRWFKEGEFAKIALYCKEDVRITKEVYEFGKKNQFIFYSDRDNPKKRLDVNWP